MILKAFKRVSLNRPQAADIIIFDTLHSSVIKNVIPDGLSVGSFNIRLVEIDLSKKIFPSLLNLKFLNIKARLQHKRGVFYNKNEDLLEYYVFKPTTHSTWNMITAGFFEIIKLNKDTKGSS